MIKRQTSFINRILYNQKFLILIGLVIIVLISFPLAKAVSQRYKIDQEIKSLGLEISELENTSQELNKLISYLESDQFVEEQARLNLGLKKEGEGVLVVKEPPEFNKIFGVGSDDMNNLNLKKLSNPQKWFNYFFNKQDI